MAIGRFFWCALVGAVVGLQVVNECRAQAKAPNDDKWQQANPARPPQAGPPDTEATLPNGAPAQPNVIQLPPPFSLTPDEQAQLDALLKDWEDKSSKIKTFKATFTRLEYNPAFMNGNVNQPKAESHGELKYAAPDKGLFHVTSAFDNVLDPTSGKFNKMPSADLEYWTCDGNSIFQVDNKNKKIIERPIPPELRGQAITEGPLPFVFGAKADTLKKRYYMRLTTPPNTPDQVWLEARPKWKKDAANYSRVELILTRPKMLPFAIQIDDPGASQQNQSRTVITFEDPSVNNPWAGLQQLFDDFARPNVLGYKHEVEQPQIAPPNSPQQTAERPQMQKGGPATAR